MIFAMLKVFLILGLGFLGLGLIGQIAPAPHVLFAFFVIWLSGVVAGNLVSKPP